MIVISELINKLKDAKILRTIAVVLLVLWLIGVAASYTIGGFIHLLIVFAAILIAIQFLQGRNVV